MRYTALVDEGVSSVTVTVETTESRARVEIAGDEGATKILPVRLGRSEILVTVTASDEVRQGFYRVTVGRGSSDATLASLGVSDGSNAVSLTPAFAGNTLDYRARVAESVSRVTVAGTPSDNDARLIIERDDDRSTPSSATLRLERGANRLKVVVVAQNDFTFKTYKVQVIREGPAAATGERDCVGERAESGIQHASETGGSGQSPCAAGERLHGHGGGHPGECDGHGDQQQDRGPHAGAARDAPRARRDGELHPAATPGRRGADHGWAAARRR